MAIEQFRTDEVVLSNINQDAIPKQIVMQGEKDGRSLTVQVTNGGVIEPQAGLNLNLGWRHRTATDKDGKLIQGLDAFKALDRESGIFRIDYASSMTQPGTIDAEIQFVTGDTVTKSQPFMITVKRSTVDENAVESESSFTVLQEALTTVSQYDDKINGLEINKAEKLQVESLELNKADKNHVSKIETMVANMPSATPKETFKNFDDLEAKYPTGDNSPMVVLEADSKTGYVYLWDGTTWQKGALYQAQGIPENSIGRGNLKDTLRNILPVGVEATEDIAYSVTDQNGKRSWIEMDSKGNPTKHSVEIIESEVLDGKSFPENIGTNERIAYSLTDQNGKQSDLELGMDGGITSRVMSRWASRLGNIFESMTKSMLTEIECFGDSLTAGGSAGTPYPAYIQSFIESDKVKVNNYGVSGQCSGAIAYRMGANEVTIESISGDIPSDGSFIECTLSTSLGSVQNLNNSEIYCDINGVRCTVKSISDSTNPARGQIKLSAAGASISIQTPHKLQRVNTWDSDSNDYLNIIWVGKNDSYYAENGFFIPEVPKIVQGMVEYLNAQQKRFLVISITNSTNEIVGHVRHTSITTVNKLLKEKYPYNYVDVRGYLVNQAIYDAGITPTDDDLNQIRNDAPPKSIMADDTHYNDLGRKAVSQYIYKQLITRGWIL